MARHNPPGLQLPSGPSLKGHFWDVGAGTASACSQGRPLPSQRRRRSQTCGRAVEAGGAPPCAGVEFRGHCPHIPGKPQPLFPSPWGWGRGGWGCPFPNLAPQTRPTGLIRATQRPPVRQQPGARFLSWLSGRRRRASVRIPPPPGRPGQGSTLPKPADRVWRAAEATRGAPAGAPRPASPTRPPPA